MELESLMSFVLTQMRNSLPLLVMLVTTRSASANKVSTCLPCNNKVSTDQKILAERFSKVREESGLTQEQFAERLGVSRNYVSMLERGAKEVSETSSIGLLFRVVEAEVAGGFVSDSRPTSPHHDFKGKRANNLMIPVVGWAHAGEAGSYEPLPDSWQEWIPTECRDEKAFAVKVEGDSMEPRFVEGDLIILMPSVKAYSGCYVVCRFANDGIVFRRLETAGSTIRLIPLNERHQITTHDPEEFSWIYPVWGRWSQLWKG